MPVETLLRTRLSAFRASGQFNRGNYGVIPIPIFCQYKPISLKGNGCVSHWQGCCRVVARVWEGLVANPNLCEQDSPELAMQ